jgi:hypothetical protein
MLKWVILSAIVIGGGTLAFFNWQIQKMEADPSKIPANVVSEGGIRLFHAFNSGVHRYVGEVKLPHSCFSLSSEVVRDQRQQSTALIKLHSTDKRLERTVCSGFSTPYGFDVLIEAPADLSVSVQLNGKPLRVTLVQTAWESGVGTVITPL